ncbi:16S rRNA (cytidine1402-2'-O)-methyltransferase [Williamsoniiplasma somnilux]|uniref:Ribosomal RNA small subunit methyltransferase I n=1 Tax=Williamsoniiplasma somnilux TaxID=215578 RepID=A0A2K8NYI5_9MOLU|nr:16S rRNA (cytidine(1402)-2'-O)-methyltransferase [Williamsoniiplasma somnilux]ATZ18879.1 16S rRNA (cytidine1402-2'-O)-methyltransferase [Williamsoniiplasma somnilux]
MIIQKTFKNNLPTIYLVGTPIGNLEDFSFRAVSILQNVDFICCEDTRTSGNLLNKYNIKSKLISLHKFNEQQRIKEIVDLLLAGKNIALISDAGAPVISDPGAHFISQLRNENINFNVSAINVGPAYIHAIVASGFNNKENYFHGFIEAKNGVNKYKEIAQIISKYNSSAIVAIYESVHRIKDTVNHLNQILLSTQKLLIARELTKINEEFIIGTIGEINDYLNSSEFIEKGEFVIVVDKHLKEIETLSDQQIASKVQEYVDNGFKTKQAVEITSNIVNKNKNEIYNLYLKFYKKF